MKANNLKKNNRKLKNKKNVPKTQKINKKNSNKSLNKKKNTYKNKLIYEIKLLLLIAFTVISIFSLHTTAMGYFGLIIKNFYFGLFSKIAYIVPYVLFSIIFVSINPNFKTIKSKYIFSAILFLLSITLIYSNYVYPLMLEGFKLNGIVSMESLIKAFDYGIKGNSTGIIGYILSFVFNSLFGQIGTYIIAILLLAISIVVGTNISLVDVFKNNKDKFNKAISDKKEKRKLEKEALNKKETNSSDVKITSKPNIFKKTKSFSEFDSENYILKEKKAVKNSKLDNKSNEDVEIKINEFNKVSNIETESKSEVREDISKSLKEIKKENVKVTVEEVVELEKKLEESTHKEFENYIIPSVKMLTTSNKITTSNKEEILEIAKKLESILSSFNVKAKVVQISKGPSITMFELQPERGVKVSKIVNLSDDIALGLAAQQIRIIAPIPGKSAVGIEIPNKDTTLVSLKDVIDTKEFMTNDSKISFALGKDISGNSIIADLEKMPHLLIAGATGSGKSVCVNTLISSILFKAKPDEVKLLMIDPKMVELNNYNGIPHLILPVVTDPKKASIALNWAVQEMTNRYNIFAENSVRDIKSYNKKAEKNGNEKLPRIVVIIDELADLMMVAPNQVEDAICRLAQMARAAGIHLIVATQRPSVDVITGLIKANIPSRIAFSVSSQIDSRTILDMSGAEKLLGKGDMLFYPVGLSKPIRVQGAFISDEEVEALVDFIKSQTKEIEYNEEILNNTSSTLFPKNDDDDEYLKDAIAFVINSKQASISMLQRKFRIGYNRAARIIDEMEERKIIGPSNGSKPREVLVDMRFLEEAEKE